MTIGTRMGAGSHGTWATKMKSASAKPTDACRSSWQELQVAEVHAPRTALTLKEYVEGSFLKEFLPYRKPSTRISYQRIIKC